LRDRNLDRIAGKRGTDPIPLYSLMSRRVGRILLVSSLYDSFTLEEDGRFTEILFSEYLSLNLRYAPRVTRVSTAEEALELIGRESFDLVISMVRVGFMKIGQFSREIKELSPTLPIVVLAYTSRDLEVLREAGRLESVDKAFTWQGDVMLFLAIVKLVEDRLNVEHDSEIAGVKCIILVEDSIRFCSSYIPMLYTELMEQTQILMTDGVNNMQRLMRMRARPKILHAETYEQALNLYRRFSKHILGIILDARFEREGADDPHAGFSLAREIRSESPECPILFQSTEEENRTEAHRMNAAFIDKNSPTLLADLREFMRSYLGFGDFLFRSPDGKEEARAADMKSLYYAVRRISNDCLLYHARRNDFSTWLMARTEFDLAHALRPQTVEDFKSVDDLRNYLLSSLKLWREKHRAGQVEEFSKESFDLDTEFVKIGSGSLGGKGRGLAFVNALLNDYLIDEKFPDVSISIPPTAVIATDVFDSFMDTSGLKELVFDQTLEEKLSPSGRDSRVASAFVETDLPAKVIRILKVFLENVTYPIAVRSSSLLEDSPAQPFAGIYSTYMLPNNSPDIAVRLHQLCDAVKLVYASTFYSDSVSYFETTPNRLEEERMAVVIQQVVGQKHGESFYPNLAGVVRSYNFYPLEGMTEEDGVASVVLGLGGTVVEGGKCIRFSPAAPKRLYQFSSTDEFLRNSQRDFLALNLGGISREPTVNPGNDPHLEKLDLERAQKDGTLLPVGSVYSTDNDMIIDGTYHPGIKLVTMAGVLKGGSFPLAPVLGFLLKLGKAAFSCEVEIEFAVNLPQGGGSGRGDFSFLQIRPMGFSTEMGPDLSEVDTSRALCVSHNVLGYGTVEGIRDIIYVPGESFPRSMSLKVAGEIEQINRMLKKIERHSLLIGPGRWGSTDSWLGIPVKWSQISTVRCFVETPLADMDVIPSQGSHFFQNITSLGIGYFTVSRSEVNLLDTKWLSSIDAVFSTEHVRHIRLDKPLEILMDRKVRMGVILKGI
jgi:DNA-binding response OmpR family regulator